ncbi:DUF3325 domain-containing protein [Azorhizophilus paspali]|uniref:DUF3325 domain-containing protein n=2 Tax=Azorhizophilus paspali TaxID=69963 RepID=A0ABV6SLX6_AZOPA
MIWLGLALCFSGFAALCLSMDTHHEQVFGTDAPDGRRLLLRLLGWPTLVIAVFACANALGLSVGIALWAGQLSIAAGILLLLLAYRPRLVVPLALAAPLLALLPLLFH